MHETTEVSFEALIYVLCLPIGLRVVGGAEAEFRTSRAKKKLPKLRPCLVGGRFGAVGFGGTVYAL